MEKFPIFPNLESLNIYPVKKNIGNLLEVDFNIDNEKISFLEKDFFLANNFNFLADKLKDNITYLSKLCFQRKTPFLECLIGELNNLYLEPFVAIKLLYKNIFFYFLPKTSNNILKNHDIFKYFFKDILSINLSVNDYFKDILFLDKNSGEINLFKNLYFLALVYYSSYLVWLVKLYDKYMKIIQIISVDKINLIQDITEKISVDTEKNLIFVHLVVLLGELPVDIINILKKYIVAGRYKKLDSSVFKILKKTKYFEQFLNEGILADQYGILLYIDDKDQLENLAKFFFEKYEKSDGNYKVNKFNDRGVIAKTADNTETSKDIIPFVNVGIMVDDLQIGEISCRFDYKIHLKQILKDYSNSLNFNSDKVKLLTRLINEIDAFDHEVYKVSQEIKILRKLFVDKKVLSAKTNLKKAAEKFINTKLEYLINDFKEKLKKHEINDNFLDEQIKYVIVLRLFDQTRQAIEDLAWEQISKKIKQTNEFKALDYNKQKELLKNISDKFKIALDKGNDSITFDGNKLGLNITELNNLFKEFKQNYSTLIKTSIFFPYLSSLKSQLEEILKTL